jgi:hypothetical protein
MNACLDFGVDRLVERVGLDDCRRVIDHLGRLPRLE